MKIATVRLESLIRPSPHFVEIHRMGGPGIYCTPYQKIVYDITSRSVGPILDISVHVNSFLNPHEFLHEIGLTARYHQTAHIRKIPGSSIFRVLRPLSIQEGHRVDDRKLRHHTVSDDG